MIETAAVTINKSSIALSPVPSHHFQVWQNMQMVIDAAKPADESNPIRRTADQLWSLNETSSVWENIPEAILSRFYTMYQQVKVSSLKWKGHDIITENIQDLKNDNQRWHTNSYHLKLLSHCSLKKMVPFCIHFQIHFYFMFVFWFKFHWRCSSSWQHVSIGSGNGLSQIGDKPLPEPMLTYCVYCVITQ